MPNGSNAVKNQVLTSSTVGEILLGVIDDVVCADRSNQVRIPGTAHASNLRTERLGDLHSQRTHTARRAPLIKAFCSG